MMLAFFNKKNYNQGFSLLEMILAVGILSVVVATLVALQSSVISVSQISGERVKAIWAMQSTFSQLQYVIDSQGQSAIPEKINFLWSADKKYQITITRTDLKEIEPSLFLSSALSIYNYFSGRGDQNLDVEHSIAPIAAFLNKQDPSLPITQEPFCNVIIEIIWNDLNGKQKHSLKEGFFLIDKSVLNKINLPNIGNQDNTKNGNGNTQ